MTKERLEEIIDSVLAWGNDHNEEFRECLLNAMGLTNNEIKELDLTDYVKEDTENDNLPTEITLDRIDIEDNGFNVYDDDELEEQLSEYLSDEYGCCHEGFNYDVVWDSFLPDQPRKIKITNIDWDTTE